MTQDEIIAMANAAAAQHGHTYEPEATDGTIEFLGSFADLVAAKEREACCAPDVTNSAGICAADMPHVVVQKYQSAIRARGQKEGA